MAADDWSGWWGGLSVGGEHSRFDNSRISDGSEFCATQTSGGASAGCEVGEDFARIYTHHEVNGATVDTNQVYDNGEFSQQGNFQNVQQPMSAAYALSITSTEPGEPAFLTTTSELNSPTQQSQARGVAFLNVFDFGAIPDLSSGPFALGGHIRRDWQTAKGWVVGVEGELSGRSADGDNWSAGDEYQFNEFVTAEVAQSVSIEPQGLGSLRARFGRDMGSWMPYVTGGLVQGRSVEVL